MFLFEMKGKNMRTITSNNQLRNLSGGNAVSAFAIGFVLKKTVTGIFNYYYDRSQNRGYKAVW